MKKLKYSAVLRDFIMMTLSVLLAFMLNSWNENRKDRKEARNYLSGIFEEAEENIQILNKSIPYHKELLNTLTSDPASAKLILKPPRLTKNAWDLAQNDVFKSNVERSLYKKISHAYSDHENLIRLLNQGSEKMAEVNILAPYYMVAASEDNPFKAEMQKFDMITNSSWKPIFQDWVGAEERYLESLQAVLKERGN